MSRYLRTPLIIIIAFITTVLLQSLATPNHTGNASTEDTSAVSSSTVITIKNQIDVEAADITFDQNSNTIFASIFGNAGSYPNTIVPINAATGQVGTPIFVGNEPNRLEVSDDGSFLYVGLNNNGSVKRIDLSTMLVDLEFFLGSDSCGLYNLWC